ncbi:hypothetical protein [Peijinzhouia sedimentorum]
MAFLEIPELATHIYAESQTAISRQDPQKIQDAIDAALAEIVPYLSRYDTEIIFAAEDKRPYSQLLTYTKDIAKWHFLAVSNANVDMELAERRYTLALKGLMKIEKTAVDGWPLISVDSNKPFRSGSNQKFNHTGF